MDATRTAETTGEPCTTCVHLSFNGHMRGEAIQPVPAQAPPRRGDNTPWCRDCAVAETLVRLGYVPDFATAVRAMAVANNRQEQLRLPGAPIGLVQMGFMLPNKAGDLELHHAWLRTHGLPYL